MPSLNEYIKTERSNKFAAANLKKKTMETINFYIMQSSNYQSFTDPVYITYNWYVKDKKKDKDNIAYAKKFIQDSLVNCNVIPNDGWNNIVGFQDNFFIDKEHPRTQIIIKKEDK